MSYCNFMGSLSTLDNPYWAFTKCPSAGTPMTQINGLSIVQDCPALTQNLLSTLAQFIKVRRHFPQCNDKNEILQRGIT